MANPRTSRFTFEIAGNPTTTRPTRIKQLATVPFMLIGPDNPLAQLLPGALNTTDYAPKVGISITDIMYLTLGGVAVDRAAASFQDTRVRSGSISARAGSRRMLTSPAGASPEPSSSEISSSCGPGSIPMPDSSRGSLSLWRLQVAYDDEQVKDAVFGLQRVMLSSASDADKLAAFKRENERNAKLAPVLASTNATSALCLAR